MDKIELGAFLRSRRERIAPADVGLPAGPRRRTPGLRRDEVAHMAFISTEYYTRLEQARGPRPSREVLSGLVRALRMSDGESRYLHRLAGVEHAAPSGPPVHVRQSLHDLLRRLPLAAGIVVSATYDVIAWNELACALMEDFSALNPRDRNVARRAFLGPDSHGQRLWGLFSPGEFGEICVQHLRAAAARYPNDPQTSALIAELQSGSDEFACLWQRREVGARTITRKTFAHPVVGPMSLNCDTLDVADRDQRLFLYSADPGSPAEEALRLLSVVGTQSMDAPRR